MTPLIYGRLAPSSARRVFTSRAGERSVLRGAGGHSDGPLVAAAAASPAARQPALRLFLCQKDERDLLRPWLRHALSLVDRPADIMVVDDASADPGVVAALREAESAGVRVQWVRPPQVPAFRRKNFIFTQWVHGFDAGEPAVYIPLDCDEFLASRVPLATGGPPERIRLASALLVVNTQISGRREDVRRSVAALAARGVGTWKIRRMRNFSHVPGLFADTRPHRWCGIPLKILVCGGGRLALRHEAAVPNRGYHATITGPQFGVTTAVCLVEFHNMPFATRQRKSMQMATVVPADSRTKYTSEAACTMAMYQFEQERSAHLQPCARSEEFAALMAHVRFDGQKQQLKPPAAPAPAAATRPPQPPPAPAAPGHAVQPLSSSPRQRNQPPPPLLPATTSATTSATTVTLSATLSAATPPVFAASPLHAKDSPMADSTSQPTAEVPRPTAEVPRPTAEVPRPTAEVPRPTAEVPRPTAEVPQAAFGSEPSATTSPSEPAATTSPSEPSCRESQGTTTTPALLVFRDPTAWRPTACPS